MATRDGSSGRGSQREHTGRKRSRPRRARLDVPPDAADPRVRGAGQAHVPGPPGCDPWPHAPRRRRRGVDRRLDRDAPPRRPVLRDVPLPRLPDRARHRRERDDGRDLRAQRRRMQGHRRLDAPDRRLQRLPRHVRDRRGGNPSRRRRGLGGADPQARPGRPLLLRRRRLQAGLVRGDAQHRVALEAADRVRDGEQRLQRAHAHRPGRRESRERRGPLGQGEGVQHAGRHDRRS